MRATWILGLALGMSCGKTLNPDYCIHNLDDPSCQSAGLATIDAAEGCKTDADCATTSATNVCDIASSTCVECTAANSSACVMGDVCSHDDRCVGCTSGASCPSGVCLPDQSCAAAGTILYAAPGGSAGSANDCTMLASPCTLTRAVSLATPSKNVVQLQGGTFSEGTITLNVPGLQLIVAAGAQVTITNASGDALFDVGQSASIAQMTLDRSKKDGIHCTGSTTTLTLDQMVISNSANNGVTSSDCTLTITRSRLVGNQGAAINASNTNLKAINNYIYGGGSPNFTDGGAIILTNGTSGQFRFNTVGFNTAMDIPGTKHTPEIAYSAGFSCDFSVDKINFSDNLFTNDKPTEYASFTACGDQPSGANWIGNASDVSFISTSASSMNLHLTSNTPAGTETDGQKGIRDNPLTDCNDVKFDFDDDVRPYNRACDYGADEFTPSSQ
jgi:hypothetical protein